MCLALILKLIAVRQVLRALFDPDGIWQRFAAPAVQSTVGMRGDRQGAGKLAVSKHTTTITLLSPCIIASFKYRHRPSAFANHHTLFTLEPRADLLPCCRRCLQPTPLIHDQRIRRGA